MVIVLKFNNVLYAESWDMLQEMNVVHYETYTDHQMATENEMKMYINNDQLAEADLHQGLQQPKAEVDITENASVAERREDLRTWTQTWTCPCYRTAKTKYLKISVVQKSVQRRPRHQVHQHWRLRSRSATLRTT